MNMWGDAAIGMTGMDFETAARNQHPDHVDPVQQLLDGHGAAGDADLHEKFDSTDISGNYADFAKALGGYGERITDPAEIIPAIKRGVQQTQEGTPGAAGVHHAEGDRVLAAPRRHQPAARRQAGLAMPDAIDFKLDPNRFYLGRTFDEYVQYASSETTSSARAPAARPASTTAP